MALGGPGCPQGWAGPADRAGLCSLVLSRIKVQRCKQEYISVWARKGTCKCKSSGCNATLCCEKDEGPLHHPPPSLLCGLRLPDGASPADMAGRQAKGNSVSPKRFKCKGCTCCSGVPANPPAQTFNLVGGHSSSSQAKQGLLTV